LAYTFYLSLTIMHPAPGILLLFVALGLATLGAAPGPLPLAYARNFELVRHDSHTELTVRNASRESDAVRRYALVPRQGPVPDLPPDLQVIRVPVRRVVAMETVYLGHMEALDALDRLVGAATPDYISSPEVRSRLTKGNLAAVGSGARLDVERVLLLQPDLILTSVTGDPAFDVPAQLARTGLPVVVSADYMERHPLARTEWIKVHGALFGREAEASAIFEEVADRYEALRARTESVSRRPTVFAGAPYSGTWHMPGGRSYTAAAIADAGGDYLWADLETAGSLPLDTERVFLRASDADFWIHPGQYRSLESLLGNDPRFVHFHAVRERQVYNRTRQVTPQGGNPIWESGVVRPDQVLADLIRILHPGLLPNHEFVFYEELD